MVKYTYRCSVCGKTWESYLNEGKYCSAECDAEGKKRLKAEQNRRAYERRKAKLKSYGNE